MVRFLSILILTGLLSGTVSKTVVLLSYLSRQAEITAQYCENKNKPAMKCHGKCHLKKQLQKSPDSQATDKTTGVAEFSVSSPAQYSFFTSHAAGLTIHLSDPGHLILPNANGNGVFHPPTC